MQNNETMTLNEKINGIMEEVYKKMRISETCDDLVEKIANKFFIFAEEQTNEKGESAFLTVDVRKVLSDAQMENIKQIIIASIRSNKADSDAWLEQFAAFNPEEPKKQFADGLDIEEEEVEEAPGPKKEVVLDKDQIKEMVQKGMTQKDIAEEIGVSQGKVQRFIAKNNLKKRKASTPSKNK